MGQVATGCVPNASCTAGVDCSGFLSRVWEVGHFTSSTLPQISYSISTSDLKKGDIFLGSGHVVLFSYFDSGNQPVYYEATSNSPYKVWLNNYSGWSGVSGYTPRRYNDISDTCGGVQECTSTVPLPPDYTKCADEGDTCNFSGTTDVAFGENGKYTIKTGVTNSIACTNEAFGCDPIPNTEKKCHYKNVSCGNPSPNSDQVGLYTENNYCGSYKIFGTGEWADPGAMGFPNDSASSVKVGSNVKAILCKHDGYVECEEFTGDDNDLSNNSIGNDSVSSMKVHWRDSTPPTGRITSPANNSTINACPINIQADASDNMSGVDYVEFHANYNGGWNHLGNDSTSPYSFNWNCSTINDQNVVLTIHVRDKAGNEAMDPGGYVNITLTQKPSEPAELEGYVDMQARPAKPHPSWSVPLHISLIPIGATTPAYDLDTTTDQSGVFTIHNITPDDYTIRIKNIHTLPTVSTIHLSAGSNTVDLCTLIEGDANSDYIIDIQDFIKLSNSFGLGPGSPGFDDRTDFNEDDIVDIQDFSLLSLNFGRFGEIICPSSTLSPNLSKQVTDDVLITIQPLTSMVEIGDIFTVTVQLQTNNQFIDAAQVSLNFDPTKLKVNSLKGNTSVFPSILQSTYDNVSGTLDYAAGTYSNFPSGVIDLVQIQFEALAETNSTPLTFHLAKPRKTSATFQGELVLTGNTDGQVIIGNNLLELYLPLIID